MPMGDNIREEEQAKVDGLRAVNRMLREQNRVLRCAIEEYAKAKTDFDDKRLQEDHHEWRIRHARLVEAETALIALTATSQEGQG